MRLMLMISAMVLTACSSSPDDTSSTSSGSGSTIPYKFGYDQFGGGCGPGTMNASPPLSWSGAPAGTKSFTLLVIDQTGVGKGFQHWVAYDIGGSLTSLAEGAGKPTTSSFKQGQHGYSPMPLGYAGPCPPPGETHDYEFTLYALSVDTLGVANGATEMAVKGAMAGKILGQATLTGKYKP
jgi:Raf kinase inhibitor-like YbhB/YbcL family protein